MEEQKKNGGNKMLIGGVGGLVNNQSVQLFTSSKFYK
jgi:hypothetical protein